MVKGAIYFASHIYKKYFDCESTIDTLVVYGHAVYAQQDLKQLQIDFGDGTQCGFEIMTNLLLAEQLCLSKLI